MNSLNKWLHRSDDTTSVNKITSIWFRWCYCSEFELFTTTVMHLRKYLTLFGKASQRNMNSIHFTQTVLRILKCKEAYENPWSEYGTLCHSFYTSQWKNQHEWNACASIWTFSTCFLFLCYQLEAINFKHLQPKYEPNILWSHVMELSHWPLTYVLPDFNINTHSLFFVTHLLWFLPQITCLTGLSLTLLH